MPSKKHWCWCHIEMHPVHSCYTGHPIIETILKLTTGPGPTFNLASSCQAVQPNQHGKRKFNGDDISVYTCIHVCEKENVNIFLIMWVKRCYIPFRQDDWLHYNFFENLWWELATRRVSSKKILLQVHFHANYAHMDKSEIKPLIVTPTLWK